MWNKEWDEEKRKKEIEKKDPKKELLQYEIKTNVFKQECITLVMRDCIIAHIITSLFLTVIPSITRNCRPTIFKTEKVIRS
jgi:hypothetical protein